MRSIPVNEYIGLTTQQLQDRQLPFAIWCNNGRMHQIVFDNNIPKLNVKNGVIISAYVYIKE